MTQDASTRQFCAEILNETAETRTEALTTLKAWASNNPQLHINADDDSLIPFLRGCKFDIPRTQKKLTDYYTMKRDIPEWYANRDPTLPQIQDLVKLGVFVPLKDHHENQLVVIIRTAAHNPSIHKQDDVFKAGNMVLDVATKDDEMAQIYGIIAIFDMTGVGLGHARQMTPGIIKKAVRSWQNYHCRPKRLEFINAPVYINVVLSIFKGFMSDKLKSRVQVHYTNYKIVPKEILPKEYGGDGESLEDIINYWHGKLLENVKWFDEDEKFRAE